MTITGGNANSSISVGECVGGEGAGRRADWEQRQTSSIPELCAHIFLSLSSRVSSADATAWRKGLLVFILSLPPLPSLRPFAEGVCLSAELEHGQFCFKPAWHSKRFATERHLRSCPEKLFEKGKAFSHTEIGRAHV